MADADGSRQPRPGIMGRSGYSAQGQDRQEHRIVHDGGGLFPPSTARPVDGFWRDADWLWCRDEKWRPVEPGTFPLVDGSPARVVRLRGYGNAVNAQHAAAFIEACQDIDRLRLTDVYGMTTDNHGVFG
jgi:DNA (cytosine-5)-methyltransferase 1